MCLFIPYVKLCELNIKTEEFHKSCSWICSASAFSALISAGIPWSLSQGRRRKNEAASKSASSSWGTTWQPACLTSPWRKSPARLFPSLRTKWRVENMTVAFVTHLQPSCLSLPCVTLSPAVRPLFQNHNPSLKQKSEDHYLRVHINSLQPIPCPISLGHTSGPNWTPWTP